MSISIRIAGNTEIPTLLAIAAKGYELSLSYSLSSEYDNWEARKDDHRFSATSPAELLGLIAMWEVRGDDWGWREGEPNLYDELTKAALTYDDDGNVVEPTYDAEGHLTGAVIVSERNGDDAAV